MIELGSIVRADKPRVLEADPEPRVTLSTAELADCTCPEFCERDHDTD
jgi:hypothetical protein